MKKFLTLMIVLLAVFLIYLGFRDQDIYYVSIGDSLANSMNSYNTKDYGYTEHIKDYLNDKKVLEVYVNGRISDNKRTIDIVNDIKNNVDVVVNNKTKTFQNVLIKADLITLSIGSNDLLSNIKFDNDFTITELYNKLDQVIFDYETLFKIMREYCKEEIILVGLYNNISNTDEIVKFFEYANKKISILANSYDIDYVNINNDFYNDSYFSNNNRQLPNKDGYSVIANKIINIIDEKLIKN